MPTAASITEHTARKMVIESSAVCMLDETCVTGVRAADQ
jgi:hypothetical protein